jgi:hypothetical protein
MNLEVAREIIQALADGMDPCTGNELAPGSPIESPDVIRALHAAMAAMDKEVGRQRVAARYANLGKPWQREDEEALAKLFDSARSVDEMARTFQRTRGAIAARLVRIGKAPDRETAMAANRGRAVAAAQSAA